MKPTRLARIEAAGETDLDEDAFPPECPYAYDEIMERPVDLAGE